MLALMLAAAAVGPLHTLAPDHWMPFAALARARNWPPLRTARVTFFCGFGHVTVSALLGILALFLGLEAVHAFGSTLEANASLLLIGFGLCYTMWALWRVRRHHHHDHPLTEWSLFLLFCADPCVAVIPMIPAASAIGWHVVGAVILVYEIATIATMMALVHATHAGARAIRFPWLDHYGDVAAGALIMMLGAVVTLLGI
jgi:Co/Zn/Cd efflux system component